MLSVMSALMLTVGVDSLNELYCDGHRASDVLVKV